MGYESVITGPGIDFSRPLNAKETRVLRETFSATDWASYLLCLNTSETEMDTDDGTLTKLECHGIEPYRSGRAYGLENDLDQIIAALPEDVSASGYIERIGEEQPDMERLHVVGRRVVSVQAQIVWPDPEEA